MSYISVYEFDDYKIYLNEHLRHMPNKGRGQRRLLAQALGCQVPFISHVLNGGYHFSVEQASACAHWLALNDAEAEFFILIVLRQRSSTQQSVVFFERQIKRRRKEESALKKKVKISEGLSNEQQITYYSDWMYAAVHLAMLIDSINTLEGVRLAFSITKKRAAQIIEFLLESNLIEYKTVNGKTQNQFSVKRPMIHIEKESLLTPQHHINFRIKAIDEIKKRKEGDVHYSAAISLSEKDFEKLKNKVGQMLQEMAQLVRDSKDETLVVLNVDLFDVINRDIT